MNKIRTIGMAAMTILGIVAIASIGAMASGPTIISIVGSGANPGETVEVPIWATNIPGNVGPLTYDISLTYNPAIVTVSNVQETYTLGSCLGSLIGLCADINNAKGVTEIKYSATPQYYGPSLGSGVLLAYVTLKAVGTVGQTSPLDISVIAFSSNNGNASPYVVNDGTFQIFAAFGGGSSGGGGGGPPPKCCKLM